MRVPLPHAMAYVYPRVVLQVFCLCLCLHSSAPSPITNPHRSDADILKVIPDYFDSKVFGNYHNSTPARLPEAELGTIRYDKSDQACNVNFKLKWSASVGSSVYATPVIFPAGAEGKKQIYMSTYYKYVEVLGYDGFKPWGWPISFEDSSFQGSPMIYDVDGDGTNDVGIVDKDANLHWIRVGEFGQYLDDYHVQVPRLKIKKNWADNLDPNFVDNYVATSMFDHKNFDEHSFKVRGDGSEDDKSKGKLPSGAVAGKGKVDDLSLLRRPKQDTYPEQGTKTGGSGGAPFGRRKLLEAESRSSSASLTHATDEHTFSEPASKLDEPNTAGQAEDTVEGQLPDFGDGPLSDPYTAGGSHDDFVPNRQHGHEGGGDFYGRHFDYSYRYYMGGMYNETNFVFVDPHVLGNPVLADANNDGHLDVLVSVSYYFDKAQYQGKELDFEPGNFIAGGVACWDLHNQEWSWMVHLDLTTDKTKLSAMIYGSPTVADLDGNGRNEVVVGTSLGLLYVLDGDSGFVRRYFPMQFNAIEASVAVGDVRGGSDLEIVVADMGGNLVLVNADGDVLWDAKLSGKLPHTPTIGDVDGDGQLDIVAVAVGDDGCHVWAVDGATGRRLAGYPIALPRGGLVSSSIILADLHDYRIVGSSSSSSSSRSRVRRDAVRSDRALPPWLQNTPGHLAAASPSLDATAAPPDVKGGKSRGLHLVMPSYDGHVYILDGLTGCAERIDVGEHIGAAPLLDDVTGDGFLDLLISTMNGQVILMESDVPYHSMNSWPSFPKHRLNGFTHGQLGVSVAAKEKRRLKYHDVVGGNSVTLSIDVWDSRPAAAKEEQQQRKYTVTVHAGSAQEAPIARVTYERPGRFELPLQLPAPTEGVFIIGMTTEHGQYFEDSVYIAVSTRFHVWLKYMVGAPLLCLVGPLLLLGKRRA